MASQKGGNEKERDGGKGRRLPSAASPVLGASCLGGMQ